MEEIIDVQGTNSVPEKPTVVRVKRKRNDAPIESIWLEVTSRPIKRHESKLVGLSLDDATTPTPDEGPSAKLLFRRVDTLSPLGIKEISLPDLLLRVTDKKRSCEKLEPRQGRNAKDKHEQLLAAAKEQHETSSRTARFEQVWKSRRRGQVEDDAMQEFFHLYDVVRVDVEAESLAKAERREQAKRKAELKEGQLLCNYLPLLREVLPSVAAEIDSELASLPIVTTTTEEYVYDVYTLDDEMETGSVRGASYPTIQIMDDEGNDWQEVHDSDYDSEDSNDENNPNNDYPEEEDELVGDRLHRDSSSDFSDDVNPYASDNEEYDLTLSDEEERGIWRPRK